MDFADVDIANACYNVSEFSKGNERQLFLFVASCDAVCLYCSVSCLDGFCAIYGSHRRHPFSIGHRGITDIFLRRFPPVI